jgi:ankyrin repeat protein
MTALDALDALDEEKFHTMLLLAADGHVGALQHEIDSGMTLGAEQLGSLARVAAAQGQVAAMEWLLGKGADFQAADAHGMTVLHITSIEGEVAALQWLLRRKGADLSKLDSTGCTPLMLASKAGHVAAMKLLMQNGAVLEAPSTDGYSAIHIAAEYGQVASLKLLLRKGASVDGASTDGTTPLHASAYHGQLAAMELLVEKGADLELANDSGTPLHYAASNGQTRAVNWLVGKGANVAAVDFVGATPLHRAAEAGQVQTMEMLVRRGADIAADGGMVHGVHQQYPTPFHTALLAAEDGAAAVQWLASRVRSSRVLQAFTAPLLASHPSHSPGCTAGLHVLRRLEEMAAETTSLMCLARQHIQRSTSNSGQQHEKQQVEHLTKAKAAVARVLHHLPEDEEAGRLHQALQNSNAEVGLTKTEAVLARAKAEEAEGNMREKTATGSGAKEGAEEGPDGTIVAPARPGGTIVAPADRTSDAADAADADAAALSLSLDVRMLLADEQLQRAIEQAHSNQQWVELEGAIERARREAARDGYSTRQLRGLKRAKRAVKELRQAEEGKPQGVLELKEQQAKGTVAPPGTSVGTGTSQSALGSTLASAAVPLGVGVVPLDVGVVPLEVVSVVTPEIKRVGSMSVHLHSVLGEGSNGTRVFKGEHVVGRVCLPIAVKVMKRAEIPAERLKAELKMLLDLSRSSGRGSDHVVKVNAQIHSKQASKQARHAPNTQLSFILHSTQRMKKPLGPMEGRYSA